MIVHLRVEIGRKNVMLMMFKGREIRDLFIAWLGLSFCFSAGYVYYPHLFLFYFAVALVSTGIPFLSHELAHKFTARRYGWWAEFRLWSLGLMIAVFASLITGGRFIFAAPGAVYTTPLIRSLTSSYDLEKKEALTSLAGPIVNILLAFLFLPLSTFTGFIRLVGEEGYRVSLWLAAFNMLPVPPMDGEKVFRWNKTIWTIITIPLWAIIFIS